MPGLLLGTALLAAGCASESTIKDYVPQIVTPYRIPIQQGNFVTQDMVEKLQVGQTRDQVRFVLGTPLLTDVFHADRWDYIFRSSTGWREADKHKLTVFFEGEKLARWVSDVPPAPVANAQPAEEPGFLNRLLGSKPAPAAPAAPAAAAASPAATVSPPPPGASVGGASNVTIAGNQPVPPPPAPEAQPPVVAPAAKPADSAGEKPEEKPGVMRRMFGWIMPGTGNSAASPEDSRAASPDPAKPPATPPNPPRAVPPDEPKVEVGTPTIAPAPASASPAPVTPSASPAPVTATANPAPPTATATAVPVAPPSATAVPVPAPAPSSAPPAVPPPAPAAAPPVIVAQAAPPPAAPPARAPEPMVSPNEILGAIEQWRSAWQDKDVTRYFAAYAPDFKPGNGLTRAKWEAQRRDRLSKPSFIIVKVVDPQVTIGQGNAAVAVFVQEYESNLLKESGRKTLTMGNYGGKWLIREEAQSAAR